MAAVLQKAFRDTRRTTLWLAIGFGLYTLFIMAFYPSIADQAEEFDRMMEAYPQEMMALVVGTDITDISIADPGVFFQAEIMTWLLLIVGAVIIAQAFNGITNAEREGTMDLMLSYPVSRRQMYVGRVLSTAVTIAVMLVAVWAVVALSSVIWPAFDADRGRTALGIVGAFLPLMVVAGFTYMLASIVPSSRRFAGPLAYLFLMGSYLLYSFSGIIGQLEGLKPLFMFHYYNAGSIMRHGVEWGNWAVLAAAALVYLAIGWYFIDKKEMGV